MQVAEKVVLVTGASMGIGRAIAHALVKRGAKVAFAARSLDLLEAEVAKAGPNALAVRLDVTSATSVAQAMAAVERRFGRLDVVVNNAGSGGPLKRWEELEPDALRAMFDVHVLGSERVMRAAVPLLRRGGGGALVNFASTLGYVAMPGTSAYNAAKAAIIMLSQTVRQELAGDGIDVRVFSPPHTSTESGRSMPLNLPKIFEPDWVAAQFVKFLEGKKAEALPGGNGALLFVQRLSPALAQRIMNGIGFKALENVARLLPGAH
ncbi:MAG: SDR family NAD(P)-dependent oxidoreductase [Myxococcaceae bacterium]|nr:SDR family NAD(P)-dependent oxidoreductase [Myxococcaceae bacterium]